MKQLLNIGKTTKNYLAAAVFFLYQGFLWAQETKQVDVNLDVDSGTETTWYGQPWLWIVGGAVFIIIIVALMRGGGKNN
jgi:hypothetical protein